MNNLLMVLVLALPLIFVTILVIYMVSKVKKLRREAEEGRKKLAEAKEQTDSRDKEGKS